MCNSFSPLTKIRKCHDIYCLNTCTFIGPRNFFLIFYQETVLSVQRGKTNAALFKSNLREWSNSHHQENGWIVCCIIKSCHKQHINMCMWPDLSVYGNISWHFQLEKGTCKINNLSEIALMNICLSEHRVGDTSKKKIRVWAWNRRVLIKGTWYCLIFFFQRQYIHVFTMFSMMFYNLI